MSAALPARPVTVETPWLGHLMLVAVLTVGVALVSPYLLIQIAGGTLVRLVYPGYVLIVAYAVMVNRRPLYPAVMIAIFAFSPFLRRVADYQAGFSELNLILLAPFVGLLPTLPALFRRAVGANRALCWPYIALVCCLAYASFMAMFRLSLTPAVLSFVPAIFEAVRWLLPISLCAFIMERPAESGEMRRAVMLTLGLILPIISVYGIYQYWVAPPWDVYWMLNIENSTFGEGEPFKIRVFSMLNAPGSACVFSALAMILLAGDGPLGLAVAAVGLPLSIVIGASVLAFGVTGLLTSHVLPANVTNLVTDRLATFSDLRTDTSTYDRLQVYEAFYDRLSAQPWGEGYGANESTITRRLAGRSVGAIDSGLMEAYLIYGVFFGTVYFAAMFELVRQAWRASSVSPPWFSGHLGVICAVIAMLPLGTIQIAETGVLVWTAFGLLMANVLVQAERGRNRIVNTTSPAISP
jgi:putative inorganic carbon (HCO3(-)) transporter